MSKTVNCTEEVVVISEGKKDIGKLVELGNDGKFDPSVIPVIDDLQNQITKEVAARTEADEQLQANLDVEVLARTNADAKLQGNIEVEANARTAANQNLQDQISKEVADRTNANNTLQASIDAEANSRAVADKDLQEQLTDEVVARTDSDTTLQSNIDAEIATRTDTDSKLQISINTEVDARTKSDQGLQEQITAEIATRTNGDETESNARVSAVQDLQAQIDALKKTGCSPSGAVEYFAMATAPEGWLKADGSAILRIEYANLFAVVGTMFGTGDGSTTFNLPDLRGEFVRGFDDGRGIDSERLLGSWQEDVLKSHTHSYTYAVPEIPTDGDYGISVGVSQTHRQIYDAVTNPTGGTETRPRNVALLACIKY